MPQSLQDFFVLEAGDYLAQLDRLVATAETPDGERFFRLARSVRGSAQVAEADGVTRVARGLEAAARALRDGRVTWNEELRGRVADTVGDLRALVAAAAVGSPDALRVDAAAARWNHLVFPAGEEPSAQEGRTRAFVERELGAVLVALERAISAAGDDPATADALRPLLQRMRPIRGLSGVVGLAPVMEVLEGVEELARQLLSGSQEPPPDAGERLGTAREVLRAFRGLPDASAESAAEEVIPVAALFVDDGGPRQLPPPAAEPVPIAELELRGDAAVRAALELRPRLERVARENAAAGESLAELWELLELALREAV